MGEASIIVNRAAFYGESVMLDAGPPQSFKDLANDTEAAKPRVIGPFRWIHCTNEGLYKGHHQGEFHFTRETFEAFVRNFRASPQYEAGTLSLGDGKTYTGGIKQVIQFDYEHASEMPPWEGNIPAKGAPAPAWALDVAVRDGADGKAQLWCFAKLGDTIRQQIGSDEYLFVSIAFTLEGVHWITGKPIGPLLTSIAFTNHPFMADLTPLAAIAAATRVTSQPVSAVAVSPGDSSRAHGEPQASRTGGARMDDKLRERICHALKIQTLANDEQVGAAVEDSAGSGSKLQSLVAALGEVDYAAAMKVVPQLKEARDNAASLLDELNGLLGQAQAADAAIAPTEVGAAMRASGYKGKGAEKALLAHRQSLIDEEISKVEKTKKPGERLTAGELVAALDAGRQAFLKEHGVSDQANAHLGAQLVAGPHGVQLSPPVTGRPLTLTETNADGGAPIDLRNAAGRNPVEKMISHLLKAEPSFASLSWPRQVERAGITLQTSQVIQ